MTSRRFKTIFLVLAFFFPVYAWSAALIEPSWGIQIAAGNTGVCANTSTGYVCWGGILKGTAPSVAKSTFVSRGGGHACALGEKGAACWGTFYIYGDTYKPWARQLRNPTQITSGDSHVCALDDDGVKCWGDNKFDQAQPPPLDRPFLLSAGRYQTCALDARGAKCWGKNEKGETNVPPLRNPTQIGTGDGFSCALDEAGVKCWGYNVFGQAQPPPLTHPTALAVGYSDACAIDAGEVKCWGETVEHWLGKPGHPQIPYFLQPRIASPQRVSVGTWFACATNPFGVKCWGDNREKIADVPAQARLDLSRFDATLPTMLTYARRELLQSLIQVRKENPDDFSDYLFLALAAPLITSTDAAYFEQEIIPFYRSFTLELSRQFGFESLEAGAMQTPDFPKLRVVVLTAGMASFRVGAEFFNGNERAAMLTAARAFSQAVANPLDAEFVRQALEASAGLGLEKQKLAASTKTAFLVDTLTLVERWLRAKTSEGAGSPDRKF